jgi:hypothetical protein
MNTKNESLEVSETRKYKMLDSLPPEKLEMVLELAARTRQIDMVDILREQGIEVTPSTLSRFLQRHREKQVLKDGAEMRETVDALVERGAGDSLRKGTMEVLRQKMYQRAMVSLDPEEERELYRDLLKEEAKLKELELEGRKAAALEEQVRVQRLKVEVMARAMDKKEGRAKLIVESSDCGKGISERGLEAGKIAGELAAPGVGGENSTGANPDLIGTGSENRVGGGPEEKRLTEGNKRNEEGKRSEEALAAARILWERMGEVLNRGGRPEEKVLEARALWEEGVGRVG